MILSVTIHLLTPLPPNFAQPFHVNTATSWPSHIIPVPTQSHPMPILSLHGHLKSTMPLQTGSLLSLPRVTSIQPRDRARLMSKQSAQTDPNVIRIWQPDTRY